MKIGIVLSKTPGYSETFFNSKIKGLKASGFDVILFAQSNTMGFKDCEVKLAYPVYKRNVIKQLWWAIVVLLKLLFHIKPIVTFFKLERSKGLGFASMIKTIYTNAHILTEKVDWLHFGFATLAIGKEHIAKAINAKMAVSLRGFDIAIYPIKHPNCYHLLWKQLDKLHVISNDLYDLALKHGLSKSLLFQKITPAIDTSHFICRKKRDFDKNGPIQILTVARLHWKKGLKDTLLALKILKENGVSFKYTVVGTGEQYEELVYIVHILGLSNHVTFAGQKTREEIRLLLETHDLYLQYSISEGFCNAVLEAQAMGMLCIVSDAEGLQENVLHGETGWVVPKRAPEQLAAKIEFVLNLPILKKDAICNEAMKRVNAEFSLEKQQKEFADFYFK